jgi:hypothetical protein
MPVIVATRTVHSSGHCLLQGCELECTELTVQCSAVQCSAVQIQQLAISSSLILPVSLTLSLLVIHVINMFPTTFSSAPFDSLLIPYSSLFLSLHLKVC